MSIITSNKNVELTDLETHVALCAQRRDAVELRLAKLENRITTTDERSERVRNLLLGGLISLAVAIAGTVFAVLFRHGVMA